MRYDSVITGKVIRSLRKKSDLSQEVLSGLAGIGRSHLTMIESGTKSPNVETLWRIAEALHMPLSELIHQIEESHHNSGASDT